MPLFKCKHHVPMGKMEGVQIEHARIGDRGFEYGLIVRYKGFCERCDAFVEMTEEVFSRALHKAYQDAGKGKPEKDCS